jgi:hypothetical protein
MSANHPTTFGTAPRIRAGSREALLASTSGSAAKRTRSPGIAQAQRWLIRASNEWLPRLTWSVQRTGKLGVSGLALLLASLVFLVSTHLPLAHEVEDLRSQLTLAHVQSAAAPATVSDYGTALLRSLPSRVQMPALLGTLLQQADAAHLSLDTGKYESTALKSGGVMTYQISFPVTGPYPQVRQFIDATLTAVPSVALSELSVTRKTIGDGAVEAQIRLTVFTQDSP